MEGIPSSEQLGTQKQEFLTEVTPILPILGTLDKYCFHGYYATGNALYTDRKQF